MFGAQLERALRVLHDPFRAALHVARDKQIHHGQRPRQKLELLQSIVYSL